MLHVTRVSKAFGAISVLREVELEAAAGGITGVIGPNGAGKSTLLYVIGGLMQARCRAPISSTASTSPPSCRTSARCAASCALSRFRASLASCTVLENLLFARPNQTGESVWKAFAFPRCVRQEERAAAARARAILERVGLWRLADQGARGLSGGQKKLLELCRALMLDPKVILLDEPAAGVSPPMRAEISRVIRALRDEGITFVIVEHDMDMVASICDRVYVFAEGRNLTCGSFRRSSSDRRVVRRLSGRAAVNVHATALDARDIVLTTDRLAAGYGGDDIISNISVAVEKGSIFTVIGPNGSGKSTFIKVLAGLLPARIGEIRLGAMAIARLSAPERVAAGLAYVPQEFNVFRQPHRRGEPARLDRVSQARAAGRRRAARARAGHVPGSRGTAQPSRRLSLGRAAPDAGICLRHDGNAERPVAR